MQRSLRHRAANGSHVVVQSSLCHLSSMVVLPVSAGMMMLIGQVGYAAVGVDRIQPVPVEQSSQRAYSQLENV